MRPPDRRWWLAVALLALPYLVDANGPDLCVVARLTSGPFSGWLSERAPSAGCLSRLVTPRGQEVHAVRLTAKRHHIRRHQSWPQVELNVRAPTNGRSYSREIVLVLDSTTPVHWVIRSPTGFRDGTSFQIIVTKRSRVVRCSLAPVTVRSQRVRGKDALLKLIRTRLQAVTSFAEVADADSIELTVGIDATAPDACNTESDLRPHSVLVPHRWKPVPIDGCYHPHLAGLGQRDVYVVEVTESTGTTRNSRLLIDLVLSGREQTGANVTLILKSSSGLVWELAGDDFAGDLLVLTEDTVRNVSLGPSASLTVQRAHLPDSFNALILYAVQLSSGPPVAYLRMPHVSRLDVDLRGDGGDTTVAGGRSPVLASPHEWVTADDWTDSEGDWPAEPRGYLSTDSAGSLRAAVSVACSGGHLAVAVPVALAGDVAVASLHLSEPGCRSYSNGTHLLVQAPLNMCGTTRREGKHGLTVYINTVYFVSSAAPPDDEDFEGSGGGFGGYSEDGDFYGTSGGSVPITCSPSESDRQQQDAWRGIDEVGSSVYGLQLATDSQFNSLIQPNLLVPLSHSIYIRPTLHMGSYLRPVVERCWVGDSPDPAAPPALLLIDSACPARPTVTLVRSDPGGADVFKLKVTREFVDLGPYYLHCSMGVCADPSSPASHLVAECAVDPNSRCVEDEGLGEKLASGVQTITKGPLLSTMAGDGGAAGGRRPPLQWGVSPETVAGIGVAAFLLGVALMAGVWLIHTKIGPSKRHHFQPVPQTAAIDAVAPSANSTPNSQTPIIVPGRAPAAV